MKETAVAIRRELKSQGIKALVRCKPRYTVEIKTSFLSNYSARETAIKIYHSKPHHWLMVSVNGSWLPMPPTS